MNSINITNVQSLEREARRHDIQLQGGVSPRHVIPLVEAAIARYGRREDGCSNPSADYNERLATRDDLVQFLDVLKTLPPRLPFENREPAQPFKGASHTSVDAATTPTPTPSPTRSADPSADPSDTRQLPVPDPSENPSNPTPIAHSEDKKTDERAEYLALLLRESVSGKSPIDDLPPDRQRALYELTQSMPLSVLAKMLAAPEPIGWNFKTSDKSLRRFCDRYGKSLEIAEHAAAIAEARAVLQQTGEDEHVLTDATCRLLKIHLYKTAATRTGSSDIIDLYMRILDRKRRTDLAERRVALLEKHATDKQKE